MLERLKLVDFDIGPTLGVGTAGTIYRATLHRTGEAVALKVLHPSVTEDPLVRARFRREMAILSKLDHPNIIRYIAGGEDGGRMFYAMEMVDGGSVKDLLAAFERLSWPEALSCGVQVASALQCAHNHGIVHRDLKPSNFFLRRNGELKLGDFGVAHDTDAGDLASRGITVGTHAYMPPEQITGDGSLSAKADLYALGCCLYEMLTGRQAFVGSTPPQVFEQHLHAPAPRVRELISDCPRELEQLIQQLMAKRPDDRPFSARQVQGRLLAIADTHGINGSARAHVAPPAGGEEAADPTKATPLTPLAPGQHSLARKIALRLGHVEDRDVSWTRVAALIAVVIVAICSAVALQG